MCFNYCLYIRILITRNMDNIIPVCSYVLYVSLRSCLFTFGSHCSILFMPTDGRRNQIGWPPRMVTRSVSFRLFFMGIP